MTATLPSWREGAARSAVLDFVDRVTRAGGADFVPPAARVAVFDNDGTLWCERPTYAQAVFIVDSLHRLAGDRADIAAMPAARELLAGDLDGALHHGLGAVAALLLAAHAGLTADEFAAQAEEWLASATHPRFDVPYTKLVYLPMIELIDVLREHAFRVFVVTGGGVEFVRATSEALYGISPEDVVGSAVRLELERRAGRVELVRQAELLGSPNEGAPKPINIQGHIGRRPIFAAGNTAGDREMLEYAHTGDLPSLCLVVDHDDGDREYAYEGTALTDPHAPPIAAVARELGWTVASMRRDWGRIFTDAAWE